MVRQYRQNFKQCIKKMLEGRTWFCPYCNVGRGMDTSVLLGHFCNLHVVLLNCLKVSLYTQDSHVLRSS